MHSLNSDQQEVNLQQDIAAEFVGLIKIILRLRGKDGCPWDQKQTPDTFKTYLIEEAHELLEAIEAGDPDHVCEELGDLLFQILFLNNLYAEKGLFNMLSVLKAISAKMIKRHPHVFGEQKITSEKELRYSWYKIKTEENAEKKKVTDLLTALPKTLPALRRAQRVSERASHRGFEWSANNSSLQKVDEKLALLRQAVQDGHKKKIIENLGDLLFSLAVFSGLSDLNAEDSLTNAMVRFARRFNKMEKFLAENDQKMVDCEPEIIHSIWQKNTGEVR